VKARDVPDFDKLQKNFQNNLDKKKSQKRTTEAEPFKFNEKKKDPNSRSFMDEQPNKAENIFKKMIAEKARIAAQ
jgi:hypothetical protein